MIRKEDGLYYEEDKALEILHRLRASEDDYRGQTDGILFSLMINLSFRLVWLSERESDLGVFTTSHRICDGMSILSS